MSELEKLKKKTNVEVHSLLVATGPEGESLRELERDYREQIGQGIPFYKFGYTSLEDYLRDNRDFFYLFWKGPHLHVKYVSREESRRVESLVERQKKSKRRGRGGGWRQAPPPPRSRYALSQSQPKPLLPVVPAILRGQIKTLMFSYPQGLLGSSFDTAFSKQYGSHIDYRFLDFSSLHDLLNSIQDIVTIEPLPSGGFKVHPKTGRATTSRISGAASQQRNLPPRLDKNAPQQKNIPPRLDKPTQSQQKVPSPRSPDNGGWDDDDDIGFSDLSGISSQIRYNIQKVLERHENGICATKFQSQYRAIIKQDLNVRDLGFRSVIELMSSLSDIVHIERLGQSDWLLYDARGPPQSERPAAKRPTNQEAQIGSGKDSVSSKKSPSAPLETAPPIDDDIKQTIYQVVAFHRDGLLLQQLKAKFNELTGMYLDAENLGYSSLEIMLPHLSDIIHMEYQGNNQILLTAVDLGFTPQVDRLVGLKRHVPPAQPVKRRRQRRELPADVVGPGCNYMPQPVPNNTPMLEVFVSNVLTPSHFWLQLKGARTSDALSDLMDELEDVYKNSKAQEEYAVTPAAIAVGQVCVAVFPEDEDWHRIIITGVKDDFVEAYYVDYGSICWVPKKSLKFLKNKFLKLPAQAIRARMTGLKPKGEEWTIETRNRMLELVSDRPLIAIITDISRDGILTVCLCDTSGETDIHVNDILVSEGLAECCTDDETSLRFQNSHRTAEELYGITENTYSTLESRIEAWDVVEEEREAARPVIAQSAPVAKPPNTSREPEPEEEIQTPVAEKVEQTVESQPEPQPRYVRYVQLTQDYSVHIICHDDKPYVISAEVSALLWPNQDIIRSMLRQKKLDLPKTIVTEEEQKPLFDQLMEAEVPGLVVNDKLRTHLTLYELSNVVTILEEFEHPSEELKAVVQQNVDLFNAQDSYWTGQPSPPQSDDDFEDDQEDDLDMELTQLERALQILKFRRQKILQSMERMDLEETPQLVEELSNVEHQLVEIQGKIHAMEQEVASKASGSVRSVEGSSKLTAEDRLVSQIVAEQSDAYSKKNSTDAKATNKKPSTLHLPMSPVKPGLRTNTVAPTPVSQTPTATVQSELLACQADLSERMSALSVAGAVTTMTAPLPTAVGAGALLPSLAPGSQQLTPAQQQMLEQYKSLMAQTQTLTMLMTGQSQGTNPFGAGLAGAMPTQLGYGMPGNGNPLLIPGMATLNPGNPLLNQMAFSQFAAGGNPGLPMGFSQPGGLAQQPGGGLPQNFMPPPPQQAQGLSQQIPLLSRNVFSPPTLGQGRGARASNLMSNLPGGLQNSTPQ